MEKQHVALLSRDWAKLEACGVCRGTDGKLYFFWHAVDKERADKFIGRGQEYVCEVDEIVDTIGMRHNTQSTDMLWSWEHAAFLRDWKDKVENPEVADLFLDGEKQ